MAPFDLGHDMMRYRWTIAPKQAALAQHLARELGISPLLAQCLLNRGLSEPEPIARFLEPRLKNLADPFALPNMQRAVERLYAARAAGETVVIFGDYDADGVTATAVLTEVLRGLGWRTEFYLPHRMDEGYGLSAVGVENCLQQYPTRLLLAVDCGSTAIEVIGRLQEQGVDVIVLDHHQVSDPPPSACALVNPQLAGADEPSFRELCSAGLAFKLAHALVKAGRQQGLPEAEAYDVRPLLDLVAIGTVADLVPLRGENRILVSAGMLRLRDTQRPGLQALKEVARVSERLGSYEVGFQLAPRLNAAGRLEDALDALRLLLAEDQDEAMTLARRLDAQNRQRQAIERAIAEQAIERIRARFDPERDLVLVEGDAAWHIGVVGIVASKVLQEFYRPTLLLGGDGPHWRGSGRSIEGFDLAQALRECDALLVRHGGHAMAAGVTVEPDKVEALRTRLNEIARRRLRAEALQPVLRLDAEVKLEELSLERLYELNRLQHTGLGNPPVQLCATGLRHHRPLQRIGVERKHVKLWVSDGTTVCEAVWWGAGQEALPLGRFDLAFVPGINTYNGVTQVQLKVLDWRPTAS